MFAIGDRKWPGVSKVLEEMGELAQVFGKLMGSRGDVNHWSGNLLDMMHDEIGDVYAALDFIVEKCGLDWFKIKKRRQMKLDKFNEWHEGDPEK